MDSCAADNLCFWLDDRLQGTCVPLCDLEANGPSCPEGTQCHQWFEDSLAACLPSCDPLNSTCENSACSPTDTGFACLPNDFLVAEIGEPCYAVNCRVGAHCVDAHRLPDCAHEACCAAYCDLEAPDCPDDTACVPYFGDDPVPEGHEALGLCAASR